MCPECGEAMIAFELDGVEIDHCPQCGGTWLDAGELERIGERAGAEAGGLTGALQSAGAGRAGKRKCPRCRKKLSVVAVMAPGAAAADSASRSAAPDQPIEIDHCPAAHGLWFDRGEMASLITAFEQRAGGEESAVARFFADMYRHEIG